MKTETIVGTLTKIDNKWFVRHSYGPPAILPEKYQMNEDDSWENTMVEAESSADYFSLIGLEDLLCFLFRLTQVGLEYPLFKLF